ncbi:MAG: hypothetical protein ACYSWR_05310 [Planctomycetota bacterium]|jgi:hypothetical protein
MDTIQSLDIVLAFPSGVKPFIASRWHINASRITFLLLQYGWANTRDVLDARKDLFKAQNVTTAALVDHTITMLSFYLGTGVLQVRPDGMWEFCFSCKPVLSRSWRTSGSGCD